MYDTETRVELVKKRVRQKQRRQEKRILCGLSTLCLLLFVSLVGTIGAVGLGHPAAMGMYGSILLHEDAGGYVLVGLIAFTAAVLITVLCIRYRERSKRNKKKQSEEEKEQ